MIKINFKQPKYIFPLVIFVPLCALVYFVMQTFSSGEETAGTVATDRINMELPEANAEEAGDKMYEMSRRFGDEDAFTAVSGIGEEEQKKEELEHGYSEEELETLLRVALLRSLGFSLEEIRRLQSGEADFAAAMRERSAALESEGQRLLAARNVCDAISREVTSYSALRPEDYLNGFEPDAAAKQRDVAEPHPLRRYLARAIDLTLTGILVSFVQFMLLHHNLVNISKAEIFL